ncbi:hypothetical protein JS756_08740 [Streptomyces actuosus]|uniref:Lipoprotein n=1 Tax=Streptomyces actuosus TaxID=1885 RepID=A0ABS2VM66_STRAS|nr:hypothetical protein [Streptomyces actuosus]MBN0044193.1 hypothetical protein [Streptomyces actuosus]
MTMRKSMVAVVLPLLLAATGCDSGDGNQQDDRAGETCTTLLGKAGETWVKESSAQETGRADTGDLPSAKERFYQDARSWSAGDEQAVRLFSRTEVCRVVLRQQKPHTSRLSLAYGASSFPFDSPFGEKNSVEVPETLVPVNSDVKLVTRRLNGSMAYSVYVKCRVPGAPVGQEEGVPLEGSLTDTLVAGAGRLEHLTYLLHSARVVADAFGCRNDPVVPEAPPEST